MSGRELVASEDDRVVLGLRRTQSDRLRVLSNLPNDNRTPLVDSGLLDILCQFAGESVQIVPAIVDTKDMVVTRYSFARPLVTLPCLDLDKSDIDDWIIPGEKIMDARLLVFKPDCLGAHHFARDSYTAHVVVSEELKNALSETGDKGLYFSRPEDMWNIFKD